MDSKKKTSPKPVKKPISGHIQKTPPTTKKGEKVSDVRKQVPEVGKKISVPTPPPKKVQELKTPLSVEENAKNLAFEIVEDYALGLEKIERFSKIPIDRIRFAAFIAIPECCDLTNTQFSEQYKISKNTLSLWRQRDEVEALRKYCLKHSMQRSTPKVMKILKQAATELDDENKIQLGAVKTFLAYAEDFNEKLDLNVVAKGNLTVQFANVSQSPFVQPPKEPEKRKGTPWTKNIPVKTKKTSKKK